MLVQEFLERSAARTPNKIALICGDQRLPYAEIEDKANRFAAYLVANGLQRGDRVAIHLHNCVEAVISIFGTLKAGGVFVYLNGTMKVEKLLYVLNNCQAAVFIESGWPAEDYNNLFGVVPTLRYMIHVDQSNHPEESALVDRVVDYTQVLSTEYTQKPHKVNIDLDLACLVYTSGSTGEAKGVMETHANVDFATDSIITYLENTPEDIILNCLPFSFDYGLYQLLMVFRFGGTLVLEKRFVFPAAILKRIQEERVTGFPGVPTIFSILLNTDLSSYDLSSLRYITNTAAALPVSHILRLKGKISAGHPVFYVWFD